MQISKRIPYLVCNDFLNSIFKMQTFIFSFIFLDHCFGNHCAKHLRNLEIHNLDGGVYFNQKFRFFNHCFVIIVQNTLGFNTFLLTLLSFAKLKKSLSTQSLMHSAHCVPIFFHHYLKSEIIFLRNPIFVANELFYASKYSNMFTEAY